MMCSDESGIYLLFNTVFFKKQKKTKKKYGEYMKRCINRPRFGFDKYYGAEENKNVHQKSCNQTSYCMCRIGQLKFLPL